MNKGRIILIVVLISFFTCCKFSTDDNLIKHSIDFAEQQIENTISVSDNPAKVPRTIDKNGNLKSTSIYSWTSGFFAGNLWLLYSLTNNKKWMDEAIKWTESLDTIQYYTKNHDVGFMINCSYGNGYRLTGKKQYKDAIIQAANSLSTRYNSITKAIKSWNSKRSWDGETIWYYPVIIDNMMNLELLFEATKLSRDSTFYNIAVQHAITTMKNHYRYDYSCYHVVNYDTISGQTLDKATNQGFADESSWARGQAWGLYGFTLCYRYTKENQFLEFAENIANYIINHPNLPEDMIPYWDYNAIDSDLSPEWNYDASQFDVIHRDASAAAITASALFELSKYSNKYGKKFYQKATQMLMSLSSDNYQSTLGKNRYFILDHNVGSIPHRVEIDVPLVYADYYYLEALNRKIKY